MKLYNAEFNGLPACDTGTVESIASISNTSISEMGGFVNMNGTDIVESYINDFFNVQPEHLEPLAAIQKSTTQKSTTKNTDLKALQSPMNRPSATPKKADVCDKLISGKVVEAMLLEAELLCVS